MIKVLLFAQLREALECTMLEVAAPLPKNVGDLKKRLAQRGDMWHLMFAEQEVLCAVNQVICDNDQTLSADDEVAFFPPVTGG